ncbi:hypothetical protein [Mycobacterium europaeum]|uniref:hypothetical protein n=1 Tax=Mycobacterium europaeum TaxID=761804 RepID=UPI001146796A|nr:hypothetical protein [Mycobacterium europaeum]
MLAIVAAFACKQSLFLLGLSDNRLGDLLALSANVLAIVAAFACKQSLFLLGLSDNRLGDLLALSANVLDIILRCSQS